ncbi:hypothetical protein BCR42DRAFT_491454 [Absidia repens]|uniref:Exonuclease domain-containing protein n=1 Tax=Absidia repens TaxID=90262 RepID=A0A1X2IGY0_9FUNG|nr:hypothetical protein BCR42DRAFT_491454 [Absidia repens]
MFSLRKRSFPGNNSKHRQAVPPKKPKINHKKKHKVDVPPLPTITNVTAPEDEFKARVALLCKNDRKRCRKAVASGQNVKIVKRSLIMQPKFLFRYRISPSTTYRHTILFILATLCADVKIPKWVEIRERDKIQKTVVVDIPVLCPSLCDPQGEVEFVVSKKNSANVYKAIATDKHADFFKHIGLDTTFAAGEDLFARVGFGISNQQKGVVEKFSQSVVSKRTKMQQQKDAQDGKCVKANITSIHQICLSKEELVENNFPLHGSLQGDQSLPDGWMDTAEGTDAEPKILALDCALCKCGNEYVPVRVTLINAARQLLLDEFILPDTPITDYLTCYSGIDADTLVGVTTTLADVQQMILRYVHGDVVLIGHKFGKDMTALKLRHPYIVDTSVIYHGPKGDRRPAPTLRYLAQRYLNRLIQQYRGMQLGDAERSQPSIPVNEGHNTVEDATAAMDLILLKLKNGLMFGLGGNSYFGCIDESLARYNKTGAVIDVNPTINKVRSRELRTQPYVHTVNTNALAVEEAIKQHARKDFVLVKLDKEEKKNMSQDELANWMLDDVKKIYDGLEPNTAMILITGKCTDAELEERKHRNVHAHNGEPLTDDQHVQECTEDDRKKLTRMGILTHNVWHIAVKGAGVEIF